MLALFHITDLLNVPLVQCLSQVRLSQKKVYGQGHQAPVKQAWCENLNSKMQHG